MKNAITIHGATVVKLDLCLAAFEYQSSFSFFIEAFDNRVSESEEEVNLFTIDVDS
jgi:hypothetical protein